MSRPVAQRTLGLIHKSLQQGRASSFLRRAALAGERSGASDNASQTRNREHPKRKLAGLGGASLLAGALTTGLAVHAFAEAPPRSGDHLFLAPPLQWCVLCETALLRLCEYGLSFMTERVERAYVWNYVEVPHPFLKSICHLCYQSCLDTLLKGVGHLDAHSEEGCKQL